MKSSKPSAAFKKSWASWGSDNTQPPSAPKMTDTYCVALPIENRALFPKKCIVCNSDVGNSTFEITGSPEGFHGLTKYQLGLNPTLLIPCHKGCGGALKRRLSKRCTFWSFLAFTAALTSLYLGWSKWVIIAASLILFLPIFYTQEKHPLPFEFMCDESERTFYFANREYAEKFAQLNNSQLS